jgi:acetyl-CoA acyltransferase
VDAVRTPYGQRGGVLSGWHPVDLSAEMLTQLVERAGINGAAVDDVIFGCTTQVGAQACNIARRAVLAAGWPESVPGVTVDRQAASSAQAVHWAAQAVMSGAQSLVVAGGIELMTAVPHGASLSVASVGKPYGLRLQDRYKAAAGGAGGLVPPGLAAEEVARRWSLDRSQLDKWALQSRERAVRAQRKRPSYMLALAGPGKTVLGMDESLRHRWSRAEVSALSPMYLDGGVVTAANMAAEGDGASALLIASAERAVELALAPVARVVSFATVGTDPLVWPAATIPAAQAALGRAGLSADDIDWWEVHESSAVAVHVWLAEMKVGADVVNPAGGALATTAPIGAVGAGLFVTAISGLVEAGLRRALVCVAAEGGIGTACVLERA